MRPLGAQDFAISRVFEPDRREILRRVGAGLLISLTNGTATGTGCPETSDNFQMTNGEAMSRLSTHILDTSRGHPAKGIDVLLEIATAEGWKLFGKGATDADGRIPNLLPEAMPLAAGDYRLRFATGAYFKALGLPIFYPEVVVHVRIEELTRSYHLPLLLSPFGYSTYRGS
jgi:5-hydroxyisourate hydrolase